MLRKLIITHLVSDKDGDFKDEAGSFHPWKINEQMKTPLTLLITQSEPSEPVLSNHKDQYMNLNIFHVS